MRSEQTALRLLGRFVGHWATPRRARREGFFGDGSIEVSSFFLLVITLIGSMTGGFDIVWNMTQGGPLDASDLFIVQLFRTAFVYFQMGYASAMAYGLFLLVLIVTILQWKAQGRWVHY